MNIYAFELSSTGDGSRFMDSNYGTQLINAVNIEEALSKAKKEHFSDTNSSMRWVISNLRLAEVKHTYEL